ncbi:putative Signal transduction histidine kinase involved in nitrogen fixation and metabolism regulation [Rhodospirillaceae bacterium LM-1]|nr:putative Signal transduction histidine kinase involved in nitrogen fixation and metabolism regulation [Rhodospirillaceae bacterium LM-1]
MTPLDTRPQRSALINFLLIAAGAGIMTAALVGLLLNGLYQQKTAIFDSARHSTELRARMMGDHAARTLEAVDLMLFSLASELGKSSASPQPEQARQKLHERLLFLPQAVTLTLYDANGELIADAKRLDAKENASDQTFFHRHRHDGALFYLEGPLPRRFDSSGRDSIRLSRLIDKGNGQFLGVLLAEIDPGFFRAFYREEDPLGQDHIALLDIQNRILASEQPDLMPSGADYSKLPLLKGMEFPKQSMSGLQRLENDELLTVFYQVNDFPLRLAVLLDKPSLLFQWEQTAQKTVFVVLGLILTYLCSLVLIGLLLQRRQAAETALRVSEAHLRAIHDTTDIGIVRTDSKRRILAVNPAFAKMLGASAEELVGRDIIDFTHPEDAIASKAKFQDLQDGRLHRYSMEKRYRRQDTGATVWTRVSVVSVQQDGHPILTFAMVEDITDARRSKDTIEALLRRSQLLLSAVGEGILGLDASGRVAFVNPAAEKLLGYRAQDMIGKKSHKLVHHHHADGSPHEEATCPMHVVLADGKPQLVGNDVFWRKDRTMMPVEYVATPMIAGSGIEGAVIAFRDISRRLEADNEIKRSNSELEQFAYAVSHDLQEPLRMVASYVQLLGRRYQGKLDKDADDFIGFAVDGAKRMQQMITDLLEYSRIQRKGNPMTLVDLNQPLQSALMNLDLLIGENKAQVAVDTPLPSVNADAAQMARLFQNLIGNALKYRDKLRSPEIHVAAKREDMFWIVSVSDNGIGIDPQYFDRIFQIFQRLHGREAYPGTGIGLAVCRRIVERHGGKIWLESEPGKGSIFFFSLPVA